MNVRISGNQIGFDNGPVRARSGWLGREIPEAVPVKGACPAIQTQDSTFGACLSHSC